MTSLAQAPAKPPRYGASQTTRAAAEPKSTRKSCPLAKYAMDRLSDDQKRRLAPCVPWSGREVEESSGRTQICCSPFGREATNARDRPSGEIVGHGAPSPPARGNAVPF